jgi:asparagine synthase (glutamine-hydrolysing)
MCGIAAHISSHGQAAALDLALITHRGPDGQGEWSSSDGRFWLGSTRLAILDLSPTGAQPMIDPETGNVIVSNGEIYNHLELRAELGDLGWRGTSDTETLLLGYRVWGRDLLERLKGMFAFAIYDRALSQLLVARDRFGIKPLYFVADKNGLRLGSEVKLLRGPHSKSTPGTIAAYLQRGACPEDKLLYPEIEMVPAGHALTIKDTGERESWRYWPRSKEFVSSRESAPQKIRALLETAVEEHLLSDVPVASFLSGGVDSSIVTALAAQRLGRRLQTFTIGFDITGFDESPIAVQVAERYGTTHRCLRLSEAEVIESVREAVDHFDLPSVDAINTYIVSRAVARHGIKVALSGLGGDELFGGYPSFHDVPRLKWLTKLPRTLRRMFGGGRLADLPNDADTLELARWRRRFFTAEMLAEAGLPNEVERCELPVELPDDFARISWAELTGYMREMLLRDSDQMSMAVSLELRVPFLDHRLVEYSLGLPAAEKKIGDRPKGLLIEAARDLLPRAVYERPKAGFALPMGEWMRGPLASFVAEGLDEVLRQKLLRNDFVDRLRLQFQHRQIHWTRLWSLVVLGHFLRRTRLVLHPDEDPALHSFA